MKNTNNDSPSVRFSFISSSRDSGRMFNIQKESGCRWFTDVAYRPYCIAVIKDGRGGESREGKGTQLTPTWCRQTSADVYYFCY